MACHRAAGAAGRPYVNAAAITMQSARAVASARQIPLHLALVWLKTAGLAARDGATPCRHDDEQLLLDREAKTAQW